eukprot:TRINITY_DN2478_c0_g1_i2.p1 TRINITY_DN2478_c0_g1~~TRINITY_DN2478_c0_g1_i2.p1  ORF type:complete len:306 (-),score=62.30 TRINITY_DN2478_c0_g1_i2:899-1816(-)
MLNTQCRFSLLQPHRASVEGGSLAHFKGVLLSELDTVDRIDVRFDGREAEVVGACEGYMVARIPAGVAPGDCVVSVSCATPFGESTSVSEFPFTYVDEAAACEMSVRSVKATQHFFAKARSPWLCNGSASVRRTACCSADTGRPSKRCRVDARPTPTHASASKAMQARAPTPTHDAFGQTRAHRAAVTGDREGLREALAAKASCVHDRDRFGRSPLHLAAWHGHLDVVRELCEAGAAVDSRDCRGCTAADYAEQHGRNMICSELDSRIDRSFPDAYDCDSDASEDEDDDTGDSTEVGCTHAVASA